MRRLLGLLVLIGVAVFGVSYVAAHWPNGGRFGCSTTGAAVVLADSPGGDCPTSVGAAGGDARWAAGRWASVKDAKVTTGLFYDSDGAEHTFVSGEDADAQHAVDVLRQVGAAASPIGTYPAASHVEVKAAVAMREAGEHYGVIVINNPAGPCPGDLGCAAALPRVLPQGATLVVWWRNSSGSMQSRRLSGGAG